MSATKIAVRRIVLTAVKALGGFALLRFLTRDQVRILCYHGFSQDDEHKFRTKYFIRPTTFERRLVILRRRGFKVITLDALEHALKKKSLPNDCAVITIDDGMRSVLTYAAPILLRHKIPATLYVTSYYVTHQVPISTFAAQYVLWTAHRRSLGSRFFVFRSLRLDLSTAQGLSEATISTIRMFSQLVNEGLRQAALLELQSCVLPEEPQLLNSGKFHLMSIKELESLSSYNIDVQLHTHRHTFPDNEAHCSKELLENQQALSTINPKMRHFCFPSGEFKPHQLQWLENLGVATATTCENGLVNKKSNAFALPRFLDGELVSDLDFEAEICGISVIRNCVLAFMRKSPSVILK